MTRPAPQHVTAQSAFSRTLKGAREGAGLSRSDLAERMGYTNVSKGASKLALWERGEDLPRGDQRPRLTAALPAVTEALDRAIEAQRALEAQRAQEAATTMNWERGARAREARLVTTHLKALSDLLASSEGQRFALTPLPFASLQLAYVGGRMLRLGELIDSWQRGELKAPCPCHEKAMPVIRIAGSPLSGTHTLDAFCTIDKRIVNTQHTAETLLSFAKPLMVSGTPRRGDGPCLEQALIAAGVTPPPIECVDLEGALIATWHPSTGELRTADGTLIPQVEGRDTPGVWRDLRGPTRQGGRPVIGALSPLSFGTWRGSRLVVTPRAHHPYYATSGHLRDPKEVTRIRWTRMPPPHVVAWLTEQLPPLEAA
ncbi:MAG: helix-turn-helix domain-containing protein [Myxococcota bacterium]